MRIEDRQTLENMLRLPCFALGEQKVQHIMDIVDGRDKQLDLLKEIRKLVDAHTPNDTSLLTTGEVAKMFKVTPPTVLNWCARGILHPIDRPGFTHRLFARASVEKLLSSAAQRPAKPAEGVKPSAKTAPAEPEFDFENPQKESQK